MKTIAIIPARGGSKRLPHKNLKLLGGLPLVAHSILYAQSFPKIIDAVYVSTNSEEIKQIALQYKAKVIDRPEHLSGDQAPTVSALKHVLQQLEDDDVETVVGAGHFVATYKSSIFNELKKYNSFKLGGESEGYFLDKPGFDIGLYRLSTLGNYAYHLGNTNEEWMQKVFDNIKENTNKASIFPDNLKEMNVTLFQNIKNRLSQRLVGSTKFKKLILKYKLNKL